MKETFSWERKQIGVKEDRHRKRGRLWTPGRIHTGKEKRHKGRDEWEIGRERGVEERRGEKNRERERGL